MDKKIVQPELRDPIRDYTGKLLKDLIAEAGGACSHPSCDSPYLSLNAHHIIQYAKGGLTTKPNGLILCKRCHRLLHDGFIPHRLAHLIKYWISTSAPTVLPITSISAEELVKKAEQMKTPRRRDGGVSLGKKTIIFKKSPLAPLFQRGD